MISNSLPQNMVEMTLDNFQQVIVEESKNKLILVAFWAEQVPESIELKDKLAAKLSAAGEHVLLASVDCQAQQQVAMQFGIQGLPTAVLVKDGQPIDGLSGPQGDEAIDEFLAKHLPKEQDTLLAQARQALADDNPSEAFAAIAKAHQLDSERADIKLTLIDVYIQTGKTAEAEQLLATIKMVDQDSYYQSLKAKLELAAQAANSPELQALEQEVTQDPGNVELQHKLAAQYSQVNRHEDALALLFSLAQKDRSDVASKDLLLDVLKALPDGDPLVNTYRRKLYTLMY
ncbi:tetratricopeptide repeat protein [Thalassomonas actiniarum]|nr:tetratricopeptide repeat protein [Thalassomonas actiniarum]